MASSPAALQALAEKQAGHRISPQWLYSCESTVELMKLTVTLNHTLFLTSSRQNTVYWETPSLSSSFVEASHHPLAEHVQEKEERGSGEGGKRREDVRRKGGGRSRNNLGMGWDWGCVIVISSCLFTFSRSVVKYDRPCNFVINYVSSFTRFTCASATAPSFACVSSLAQNVCRIVTKVKCYL